jgi:hypothetical protein
MNKLIILFVSITLFCNFALADCDFSTGITPGPNDTYIYSKACHLKVGQLVKDNATQAKQIVDLTQATTLYRAAIQTDEERIQKWIATSTKLEEQVVDVDKYKKSNEYIAFGLGILSAFAAAELANSLRH